MLSNWGFVRNRVADQVLTPCGGMGCDVRAKRLAVDIPRAQATRRADRSVEHLRKSAAYVRDTPNIEGGMAPIYGLAASIPDRTVVHDMLKQVMDIYYRL